MTGKKDKSPKTTLSDEDITVSRPARRAFLGLMAAGGASVAMPGRAQAYDQDNGNWTDSGACPRGAPGGYTGMTDHDNGNWMDAGGYGRGRPYC